MMDKTENKLKSTVWLEAYLSNEGVINPDLSLPNYRVILDFTLLWNLFEAQYLPPKKNKESFHDRVKNISIPKAILSTTFSFFYNRYIKKEGEGIHIPLSNLFEDGKKGNKECGVLRELFQAPKDDEDRKTVCFSVIYRFRNNLFHGNKNLSTIWNQDDIFKITCDFLIACMDIEDNKVKKQ